MLDESRRQELRHSVQTAVAAKDARTAIGSIRALLRSDKPSDVQFCARAAQALADEINQQPEIRRLRTFVVRSVTVEPVLPYLQTAALLSDFFLETTVGGFGSYMDDLLSPQGAVALARPDLLFIILDLEDVAGHLPDLCADGVGSTVDQAIAGAVQHLAYLLDQVRANSNARILLQGFVVPDLSSLGRVADGNLPHSLPRTVSRLNDQLAQLCASVSDCVFFDVDAIAAQQGRLHWSDKRLFLASRLPLAAANFAVYARALVQTFRVLYRAPRKVLCTDLDNTLWGGVLGEDGVQGIVTGTTFPGSPFYDYQRYLKQLTSRGILLAAVSKNNEADVREAFAMRSADLALSLEDFTALKINWNDKAQSLQEIARELSLGTDSFVFIDDNPVEAEAIRQHLPEVTVIEAPVQEPWRLPELIGSEGLFDVLRVTTDDHNRLTEYKAQKQRATLEASSGGRDEFLASLDIVCTMQSALEAPLARAVQLLAKTNQFNLTTRRHTAGEIENFAADPAGQAVVIRVRDRFGDAGVVGLALARNHGSSCFIDSLLLSCRVIGRGIETALLAHIAHHAAHLGATRLVGEFVPSAKNAPAASFYPDHGFTRLADEEEHHTGAVFYDLDLLTSLPNTPPWIATEGTVINELATSTGIASLSPR